MLSRASVAGQKEGGPALSGGCSSKILLAMAEAASLEEWKLQQKASNTLSVPQLVNRAGCILDLLETSRSSSQALVEYPADAKDQTAAVWQGFFHLSAQTSAASVSQAINECFSCAVRVYVHTIVSGPFPSVPEVAAAVESTIDALETLNKLRVSDKPHMPLERLAVFPIAMAGCHARNTSQREFFRTRLLELGPDAVFGNLARTLELMEEVWRRRSLGHEEGEIHWRSLQTE
jgi:C6 transcription factor Pro1